MRLAGTGNNAEDYLAGLQQFSKCFREYKLAVLFKALLISLILNLRKQLGSLKSSTPLTVEETA